MGTRKEMTIGVTINLDNYENIRLDVTGEVESEEDVSELTAFLDGVLAGIGREDEATAERVDHYRSRVFGSMYRKVHPQDDEGTQKRVISSTSDESTEDLDADSIASCPVTGVEELLDVPEERDVVEVDIPEPILPYPGSPYFEEPDAGTLEVQGAEEPGGDEPVVDKLGAEETVVEESVADESVAEAPVVKEPGADRPGTGSAGAAPRFLCEACGIEVSKVQHDVSHLFMNRTLCKQCMNTL
ncbi:MAG: hypothetical protein D5R96_00530 [Methanocalculus sp. MSAO_Arc2]|uniref:hypothetical protein n=1 Tax=Methanocalculus sp. MSAO_Arc2 TaxID=2293855 RepID=UPI000FEEC415|nr:MAG: hypothetical protein D5R96_00530 [Methanocalculus sp. MSAO_Arc2]